MEVAKLRVYGATAEIVSKQIITSGMIGAQIKIEYADPIWDGLQKTVVFDGSVVKDKITNDALVEIPPECVSKKNWPLRVGVYGLGTDGKLLIPTIYADFGIVQPGADPSGDTTTEDNLPVWAQIQTMIGDLAGLNTQGKDNLVSAINEVLANGGGTVDEATVQRIVDDYLAENPPAGSTVTDEHINSLIDAKLGVIENGAY